MENLEARQSRGTACLPRRAGEWFSRGLRLACSHGVRRVSTASVGRQFPGLGQGRPLRPISGAKRRHDLSREEPHLLEQQIRRFILEQADVTKGQGKMLEAALSKVFEPVNHLVGASRTTGFRVGVARTVVPIATVLVIEFYEALMTLAFISSF